MQCMQFRAWSAKNELKPTDFLKRNFYFETEGVHISLSGSPGHPPELPPTFRKTTKEATKWAKGPAGFHHH